MHVCVHVYVCVRVSVCVHVWGSFYNENQL
jgi:hypothetical protein